MSKKATVTKAFMRENTVFADAFNRIKQVPCFHCEKLAAAVQEVKKNAWYEKERLNMEEHLSTDTSDPISVIKDYIRSHLSDPDLGRTSIAEKIHMNLDYLLATTSFSPQQICDQIGIANVSYFYRQFKKSSGVTPQQYREKHFHG